MPKVGPEDILLKVKNVGICGSDLFHVSGKNDKVRPPIVLGHEISGTVEKVGAEVPKGVWKAGDRVGVNPLVNCGQCRYCRSGDINLCENLSILGHQVPGGFAEYVKVHYEKLVRIPDNVGFDDAYILEPIAVVVHAFSFIKVSPGDEVVVLGGGPIGLLAAQLARIQGATKIVVTDITEHRLSVIEKTGFIPVDARQDDSQERILAEFDKGGADIVIEAVGSHQTALQMAYLARSKGQVLVVGLHKGIPEVDLRQLSMGEQAIRSVRLYVQDDFIRAARLLGSHSFDLSAFGNYRLPLEDINKGFDLMRKGEDTVKVVIDLQS
jgi:threonine dehydrogenase-like Zn-dependent dehydrogenase